MGVRKIHRQVTGARQLGHSLDADNDEFVFFGRAGYDVDNARVSVVGSGFVRVVGLGVAVAATENDEIIRVI